MAVIHVTKANFEELVVNSDKKVLLDFWAPWCGPCKMVLPIVEEIAEERTDFKVCKINVDDEGELARQFRVMSIPTVYIFKDGQPGSRIVGLVPKEKLLEALEAAK